jgi:colanic acid/amylovoran biosynthesis glycosyltransferase
VNRGLKIAFVSGGLPSGGSTIFLLHLMEGLRALGVCSEVFSFRKENPLGSDFSELQVPVHAADESRQIFEDRLAALYRKMAEFQPNAVIANLGAESLEMLQYAPRGVVRIAMIHEEGMLHGPPKYKEFVDGVAIVNPAWVELASQRNPTARCRFLAHGIPLPAPEFARTANPAAPLRLVYFGRLNQTKGTHLFPEIAKQLAGLGVPFHWTLYGNGPEENWLRTQFAAAIRDKTVTIAPHVPRQDLFHSIRKHDVFIMASESEGGPLTLLEAMAVGLVPVCGDIPCLIKEVVNRENGFVVPRNPMGLARSIAELHSDRPRLERMSAAARRTITEKYSLRGMAGRYVEFIEAFALKPGPPAWPKNIRPRPIRGLPLLSRISQGTALGRQMRRIAKRRNG